MQAIAYHRARNLLSTPSDPVIARILGTIQSLLIVALLGVAGPVRGPDGLSRRGTGPGRSGQPAADVGGIPPVGRGSGIPALRRHGDLPADPRQHRERQPRASLRRPVLIRVLITRLPTLRNNLGALATLLATGLILLVLIEIVAVWRRVVIARAATRRGHRAAPADPSPDVPAGPVVAADRGGRAGDQPVDSRGQRHPRRRLFADLDITPRLHVLAGGLLVVALLVSPILTVFLASVGLLVWMTARVMDRDARIGVRRRDARRRGPALPAARGPRAAPHGPGLQRGGLRPAAVRRAPRAVPEGRQPPAGRPSGRLNPSTILLFGAALAVALGLLGYNVVFSKQIAIGTMLILLVALTGLAYPIMELIRHAEGDPAGEPLGRRGSSSSSSGSPSCTRTSAPISSSRPGSGSRFENVTLESRSGRVLLDGVSVEIPAGARTAILGFAGRLEARPGLPDPPADRPQGRAGCGSTATTSAR